MFRKLIFLLFISVSSLAQAQLVSDQTLPMDVKFDPLTKFNNDLDDYGAEYKTHYKYKENLQDFFAVANYELMVLYKSGKLVFNKKMDDYLNNVFNKILENIPEMKDRLRLYVIKSSQVNAFTFHSGEIFVTLGLIAQLGNEAQLAYILSHELSHFKLGHHVNGVIKSTERKRSRTGNSNISEEAEELLDYAFSRELEFEADSLGFLLTKKSPYASSAALGSMDVLQYSYLPLNEVPFHPKNIFRDSVFVPATYLLDKIHSINFDSDKEEDSRSTHPNVAKRRKYINDLAEKMGNNNGATYIVGKKEFMEVRDMARKEFCDLLLRHEEGVMGFYNAYVLYSANQDEGNHHLVAKGLYEIAMQKQNSNFSGNNDSDDFEEGESERAYHFFKEITQEQALFLALHANYTHYKTYHNEFSKLLSEELMRMVLLKHSVTLDDIKSYFEEKKPVKDTVVATPVADTLPQEDEDSKYAKIRKQKIDQTVNVEDTAVVDPGLKFHFRLFQQLVKDNDFSAMYLAAEQKYFKNTTGKPTPEDDESVKVVFSSGKEKKKVKTPEAVVVNKGLLFCPLYSTLVKKHTDFFVLEQEQKKFSETASSNFVNTGVNLETLSYESLVASNSIAEYNEYCQSMEYVNEVLRKENYMPLSYESMRQIQQAKGYSHIILGSLTSYKQNRSNMGQAILIGIVAFPLFPAMMYYVISKEKKQKCYLNVIDLNTHQQVVEERRTLGEKKMRTPVDFFSTYIKK